MMLSGCAAWPTLGAGGVVTASATGAPAADAAPITAPTRGADATGPFPVTKIVDGDTIWIRQPTGKVKVRLLGIDTPETRAPGKQVECFGREATAAAVQLLTAAQVWVETDPTQNTHDRYGRLLAYVWLDDDLVNLDLITGGYAAEYTYDKPYRLQQQFRDAQTRAQDADRGRWSACGEG